MCVYTRTCVCAYLCAYTHALLVTKELLNIIYFKMNAENCHVAKRLPSSHEAWGLALAERLPSIPEALASASTTTKPNTQTQWKLKCFFLKNLIKFPDSCTVPIFLIFISSCLLCGACVVTLRIYRFQLRSEKKTSGVLQQHPWSAKRGRPSLQLLPRVPSALG